MPAFALVHSPIVGPDTWEPVAEELGAAGESAAVARLSDDGSELFWHQHVTTAARSLERDLPAGADAVVVVHSGAGQLAAQLGRALFELGLSPAGYLFVDAGLPPDGGSRLDQLREEDPEFASELEDILVGGHPFPDWSDEQLQPLVPDHARRSRLLAGLRHLPIGYWTETIPAVPGWDSAPTGVLVLSGGYEATASSARQRGWPIRRLDTDNHFHMLDDPTEVAWELRMLTRQALERMPGA